MAELTENFTDDEFRCKCGCGICNVNKFFLVRLQRARTIAEIPFPVASGCRCPSYNATVGGVPDSSHVATETVKCCAADIKVTSSHQRWTMLSSLHEAGFKRMGIAKGFIHVDNDLNKPQGVTWLY